MLFSAIKFAVFYSPQIECFSNNYNQLFLFLFQEKSTLTIRKKPVRIYHWSSMWCNVYEFLSRISSSVLTVNCYRWGSCVGGPSAFNSPFGHPPIRQPPFWFIDIAQLIIPIAILIELKPFLLIFLFFFSANGDVKVEDQTTEQTTEGCEQFRTKIF